MMAALGIMLTAFLTIYGFASLFAGLITNIYCGDGDNAIRNGMLAFIAAALWASV